MYKRGLANRCLKIFTAITLGLGLTISGVASANEIPSDAANFYKSDKVTVQKVTFSNQYDMKVGGNLFTPNKLKKDTKKSRDHCRASHGGSEGTKCESLCHENG
jgi:hypothetical protein